MEDEPRIELEFSGGVEFNATRDNSTLFRFFGRLAMYDHIYFVRDEETGYGSYLFSLNPSFEQMATYMTENQYPAHLNLPEVAECDEEAFDKMLTKNTALELEDGIPDDWS